MMPQKSDKTKEGLGWIAGTAVLGSLAVVTQNPLAKLVLLLGAVATGSKAVDCFRTAVLNTYQELQCSKQPELPPAS